MSDTAIPSMHGTVTEVGDFRLESSSLAPSAETPAVTLEKFVANQAVPADGDTGDAAATSEAVSALSSAAATATQDAKDAPPKKRDRVGELQARIHATTREKHEAEAAARAARAEAEAETARLADLRREREALERGETPAKKAAATTPAATDSPDDPMPDWTTDDANGVPFPEHLKNLTAWVLRRAETSVEAKAAAKLAMEAAQAQTSEEAQRVARIDERHTGNVQKLLADDAEFAAATNTEDFKGMPRTPFMTALIKLHEKGSDILRHLALNTADGYAFADLPMTEPIMATFRESDDPVRLLTILANNDTEAQRIARLSPTAALRALWTLENSAPDAKTGTSAVAPRQPVATPLPAKVGGSRSVATTRPLHELGTEDFEEYARRVSAGESLSA